MVAAPHGSPGSGSLLLAIDTATRMAGIALYDQRGLHAEQMWRTSDNHTSELMPYIARNLEQQRLAPSSLQAIGVSLGPGSFTGLRVGLSVAKGLALALTIPLLGISTLDAAAYAHHREHLPVRTVLPAGRGRWCTALYRTMGVEWRRQGDYNLMTTGALVGCLREPTLICGETDPDLEAMLRAEAPEYAVLTGPASAARRPGFLAELAWQRFVRGDRDDLTSLSPIYVQPA